MKLLKLLLIIYLSLISLSCEKNPVDNENNYPAMPILVSSFESPVLNFTVNKLNPENIIAYTKKNDIYEV